MAWPRSFIFALIAACSALAGADAHDLWLTRSEGPAGARIIVNYGHPGDRPPPAVEKLLDLNTIGSRGDTSIRDGVFAANLDVVPARSRARRSGPRRCALRQRFLSGNGGRLLPQQQPAGLSGRQ